MVATHNRGRFRLSAYASISYETQTPLIGIRGKSNVPMSRRDRAAAWGGWGGGVWCDLVRFSAISIDSTPIFRVWGNFNPPAAAGARRRTSEGPSAARSAWSPGRPRNLFNRPKFSKSSQGGRGRAACAPKARRVCTARALAPRLGTATRLSLVTIHKAVVNASKILSRPLPPGRVA